MSSTTAATIHHCQHAVPAQFARPVQALKHVAPSLGRLHVFSARRGQRRSQHYDLPHPVGICKVSIRSHIYYSTHHRHYRLSRINQGYAHKRIHCSHARLAYANCAPVCKALLSESESLSIRDPIHIAARAVIVSECYGRPSPTIGHRALLRFVGVAAAVAGTWMIIRGDASHMEDNREFDPMFVIKAFALTVVETKQALSRGAVTGPGLCRRCYIRPNVNLCQPLEVSTSASTKKPDGEAPDFRGMIPNTKVSICAFSVASRVPKHSHTFSERSCLIVLHDRFLFFPRVLLVSARRPNCGLPLWL